MVIGNANRWPISHGFAKRPAMLVELAQIVQNRPVGGIPDDAISTMTLVQLVARKIQQVGIKLDQIVSDRHVGKSIIVLTGQRTDPQRTSRRIRFDCPRPICFRLATIPVSLAINKPVRRGRLFVPIRNPKGGGPSIAYPSSAVPSDVHCPDRLTNNSISLLSC